MKKPEGRVRFDDFERSKNPERMNLTYRDFAMLPGEEEEFERRQALKEAKERSGDS